jgi:PAS domain S-box-containing protein
VISRRFSLVSVLALLAVPSTTPTIAAEPPALRTVLTVHWSTEEFPSTPVLDAAIRQGLHADATMRVDYFAEYLESDRFPAEEASASLRDYIKRKFNGRRIDVVLAVADPALEFVQRYRAELFPDAPIVASVVRMPAPEIRAAGAGITGVVGGVAADKTLELALRLHPTTKRVFVVAHAPTVKLTDTVRPGLEAFAGRVDLTYLEEPSVDRLLNEIKAIPPDSLVLFVRHSQEHPGDVLYPGDVARRVSEASPVPVYGQSESSLGSGIVGGVIKSRERIGRRLGEIARQILAGERAQAIPVRPVPATPAVDWRQVTRWHIDPSAIPSGTDVWFRELTPWEQYRSYIVSAAAVLAVQSALIGGLLIHRRRRRRAEAALRESEAHFRVMADTAPVLIWRSGTDGRLDFCNLPWLRFTGRTLADELRVGWTASVHPDDRSASDRAYRAAFDARAPFQVEYRFRRSDGEYRWMLNTGVPRHDANGVFAGFIGSCLDLSDRRQAELDLDQARAELNRVSRLTALGEFAAAIGHEARQPLQAIILNAQSCLFRLEASPPDLIEVRAGLRDVMDSACRAGEVIQRNRELFRNQSVQTAALNINDVIADAIALARPRLTERHITLATALGDDVPAVSGDRIELQQVILNLLANAIDAMDGVEPRSRRLNLASSRVGDGVKVTIADTGVGLRDVDVERMFSLSYTTKANGTGVGLSISRSIIEAHGGRVWAEPASCDGATFCFTVPRAGVAPSVPAAASPPLMG